MTIEPSASNEMRRAVRAGFDLYAHQAASWQQIAAALRAVPEGTMKLQHELGLRHGFCGAAGVVGDEGALRRWRRGWAIYRGTPEHEAALLP